MSKLNKKVVIGYVRVSSSKQEALGQELELRRNSDAKNLKITQIITVTASSQKTPFARRLEELQVLLGKDGILLVTELSRLGRTTGQNLMFVDSLIAQGITIIFTKKDEMLHKNNREKTLINTTLYSLYSELERQHIVARTREALLSKKELGIRLGKPHGSIQKSMYDAKLADIKLLLAKGIPITNIRKIIGIGKILSLWTYLKKRKLLVNNSVVNNLSIEKKRNWK